MVFGFERQADHGDLAPGGLTSETPSAGGG